MHQTVREFFLKPNGPVAISRFKMREDDARKTISMICFRYLILFVARSTQADELPNPEFWEPVHFRKYVEHLNERTLIDFALSHFQQHKDDRTLHPQKHNQASQ